METEKKKLSLAFINQTAKKEGQKSKCCRAGEGERYFHDEQHNKTKYGGPAHTTQTSCVLFPMIPNWLQFYFGGWGGDFLLATQ